MYSARALLVGHLLAGLLGGLAAGVYDALAATTDPANPETAGLLLGAIGANVLLGVVLGFGLGLFALVTPPEVSLPTLTARAVRRLLPGADDPLHERAFVVSTLVALAVVSTLVFGVFQRVAEVSLSRVQSANLLALLLTLLAVLAVAFAVVLVEPLRAVLGRGLERIVLRAPRLSPMAHPLVALVVLVVVATLRFAAWRAAEAETWDALDLRPLLGFGGLLLVAVGGGAFLGRRLFAEGGGALGLVLAAPLLAGGALAAGLGGEVSQNALVTATGTSRFVLEVMRLPFDRDADGFASVLGGGDCDDDDPAIHPGAVDRAGNALDEDCDGADAEVSAHAEGLAATPVRSPVRARIPAPQNLVLITVDSLRADRLGFLGESRPTSPEMDRLAAESVVFTHAWSTSSKTPTAVPSMLTGRFPSELFRDAEHFTTYAPENLFVTEVLHGRGYRTAAYPSHWYFDPKYGLGQGFETWQPFVAPERQMEKVATAEPVVVAATKYLDNVLGPGGERPFFLWVHLLDPHKSYLEHGGVPAFGTTPAEKYLHEVRYTDAWVGKLLDALRKRADWGRTSVVLTSDHGEAFGEHGYRFHGFGLHEHQLRVPLVVRVPGVSPARVETPVSLIDLTPTLLDLAGIEAPAGLTPRGRSLVPALLGETLPPRPVYAETPRGPYNPPRAALVDWPWKVLYDAEGDRHQLFQLDVDPGEQNDLYRKEPEPALRMRGLLRRFWAESMKPVDPRSVEMRAGEVP